MENKFPFAQAILDQTNGGLDIICGYYPEVGNIGENSSKKFKRRLDEKTASCSLKKTQEGTWIVCDWGAWEKPKNAFGVCMFEDNLTFGEACKKLAKLYNIQYKGESFTSKPTFETRPKTAKETSGTYIFEYKEELTDKELAVFGPKVTNEIARRFKLKSIKKYSYITETEVKTTISNEDYPIFAYDFGDWQKIYQPKTAEKKYRFRYAGGRPKDYVFGLGDAEKTQKIHEKNILDKQDDDTSDDDLKLKEVIICSGDRDALNVSSFGYSVVWLNSETASVSGELYKKLQKLTCTIYNLPDIDKTGVTAAVKLGLQFLEIKTIWLPKYLLETTDWRGNARKDFLDFINLKYSPKNSKAFTKFFKKLIDTALPMKFWSETPTDKGIKYFYNIVHAEHFLKHQGFFRMETPFEKDEYCYIQIDGNIVKRTTPNKIEVFVNSFLEKRQLPIPLRNMVKKTPYLKESMLSKLPLIEIDFVDSDAQTQFWFFKKNVIEIKANGIRTYQKGVLKKMVLEDKVIDYPKQLTERQFTDSFQNQHFKIFKDAHGNLDIKILKTDNKFLNYLINTSRIHWRRELEGSFKKAETKQKEAYFKKHQFDIAGANLNEDEVLEQKLHLINKIFAIGYLLHKYKVRSKGWFVFGIDNKLSDIGESHGGSGKSLMFDNLEQVMKNQFFIPGRSKKAIESEFIFDGVTKDTDYAFIDDMNQYFPFQQFFSEITGKMKVNPKNAKGYTLNFNESPKLCGTSNFPPNNLDPSTSRRILFTVNSDYYHHNKDNEYEETRKVSDDFAGKELFNDFTETEFVDVFSFWAQCCQFFLSHKYKIDPPMNNVRKRNLMSIMGDAFRNWANVYFDKETDHLDCLFSRFEAYESYKKVGKKSANSFKKSIQAFCEFKGYIFNPSEVTNNDGRIIQRLNTSSKPEECFYIKTTDEINPPKETISNNEPTIDGVDF